ncbi:diamine N-acetyltransferase [Oceanococcus atlanticus]|uniref:Diamine N-acetyltransferase n=1 Tax=Oceanococcus atlanticus TaxID=1317117 RepID=A0A1Y1SBB8_9GAMM|nr:GNAT family N-acetyltransferase [Oceanococcus atlanticus]ORE85947.1 diamine N-acetyltransferase [Oceanococcus atlanticus]
MTRSLNIRPAVREDAAQILDFIRQLAIYEKAEHEVLASEDDILRHVLQDNAVASALICERDGVAIGFAVYFFSYSTWLGKPGLFLEDLFVLPEHRGDGAGKALLVRLAQLAVDKGCGRMEWNVLNWNSPAIGFYESLKARPQSEWTTYRLHGEALAALAHD